MQHALRPRDVLDNHDLVRHHVQSTREWSEPALPRTGNGTRAESSAPFRGLYDGPATKAGPAHRISASGVISDEMWRDPARGVAANLTQYGADNTDGPDDAVRCGAAAVLGGALMNGRESTAQLLLNAAARMRADPSHRGLSPSDVGELRDIAEGVRNGLATYEDLNRVQQLLFQASRSPVPAANPGVGLADTQVDWMARGATTGDVGRRTFGTPGAGNGFHDYSTVQRLVETLKPGESSVMRVGGDTTSARNNHFVTIGRQPDGTPYIYNPDPSATDTTVVAGARPQAGESGVTPAMHTALAAYNGRAHLTATTRAQVVTSSPGK